MINEGTVTPIAGTETQPGTVTPVEGHGNFFEFVDDSGNPIDTTSKPVSVEPVALTAPVVVEPVAPAVTEPIVEPADKLLEPNIQEQFGFELETYEEQGLPNPPVVEGKPPVVAGEQVAAKENPTSQEYWQSQADKRGGDLSYVLGTLGIPNVEEFKTNYNQYKNIMPIAKYIKNNPQILDTVDESLANSRGGQTNSGVQPIELKPPDAPVKPHGYNKVDAVQEPDSESWKAREAEDQYNRDMMNYQIQLMQKEKSDFQEVQRVQAQETQIRSTHNQLVNQYKMEANDATDFINYMSSPQSQNMDNLVLLWKMQKAPQGSVQHNLNKADTFRDRVEKQKNIKPGLGGVTGGPQTRPLTPEEEFNLSLLQNRNLPAK